MIQITSNDKEKGQNMPQAAPIGVGWGTTNTPDADRIDPSKTYRTRDGSEVINVQIVLFNSCGHEVTFPVKGTILRKKKVRTVPEYHIWTLDGRSNLFNENQNDLVLV
jgi:hypothetical protein